MKLYFIISLLPCLFYLLYKSKRPMHMLQQNWYNDGNRYLKWLKDNFSKSFINVEIVPSPSLIFVTNSSIFSETFLSSRTMSLISCLFCWVILYKSEEKFLKLSITCPICLSLSAIVLLTFLLPVNKYRSAQIGGGRRNEVFR